MKAPKHIRDYFGEHPGEVVTCEDLQSAFSITLRTVKQYMANLASSGEMAGLQVISRGKEWIYYSPKVKRVLDKVDRAIEDTAKAEATETVSKVQEHLVREAAEKLVLLFQQFPGRAFYLDDLCSRTGLDLDLVGRGMMEIARADLLTGLQFTVLNGERVWQYMLPLYKGPTGLYFEIVGHTVDGATVLKCEDPDTSFDKFYAAYELTIGGD